MQSLVEFSEGTGEDKMPLVKKNVQKVVFWFFLVFYLEFVLLIPSNHFVVIICPIIVASYYSQYGFYYII